MSYSTDIRLEISGRIPHAVHCRIAFLAGIVFTNGSMSDDTLVIRLKDELLQKLYIRLMRSLFEDDYQESDISSGKEKITDALLVQKITEKLKLRFEEESIYLDRIVLQNTCCKSAFLKGCFLAAGSVTDPNKSYHLEFSQSNSRKAEFLGGILKDMSLPGKIAKRRDGYIVYLKDSDSIVDALGVMGAGSALMTFENVRILKEIRNSVNREVNCDTANMNKVANAAAKDIEDIEYIEKNAGLSVLPDTLRELAEMRLQFPYLSLKDLGQSMNPPLGKSGVNHRIRRIREIADKMRMKM